METDTVLEDVKTFETRAGNVRYVARDVDGNEYTTFRDAIGEEAKRLRGERVRITSHESQRGEYTNVYLDKLEPLTGPGAGSEDTDPQEAAWRTAVEAAPWLVGKPGQTVDPEDLYETLKPFEERVASDIEKRRRE